MPDQSLLLPAGHRLLHIGPPKTATTVVQSGFHHNREALARQGVHYAGPNRHPMAAALEVALGRTVPGHDAGLRGRWPALLEELEQSGAERGVISSEFLADAPDPAVRTIVDSVGADRVHVLVTLRSLGQILPSQWQQYTQVGLTTEYETWLRELFDQHGQERGPHAAFWRRHDHDELVRRWAEVVGPENVTVLALDESDRDGVLHVFEDLVGLERGTLRPSPEDRNRSLTLPETALMREVVQQFEADGLERARFTHLLRYGFATHLKTIPPAPGADPVTTPPWAADAAAELGAAAATRIGSLGVRVIGDLGATLVRPPAAVGSATSPTEVSLALAARGAMGVVHGADSAEDLALRRQDRDHRRELRAALRRQRAEIGLAVKDAGVRDLLAALRRQLPAAVRSRVRGRRGRRPSP